MSSLTELRELTRVRILLFLREPEALFWVFGFPLVLAAVLGFAFRSSEPRPSVVRVLAGDGADALVERLARVERLEVARADDATTAEAELRRGKVDALVAPAADGAPRLLLDPQRPEAEAARLRVLLALALEESPDLARLARLEPVEERGSRYVDFLFPGLIGMNLMGTGMWSIGFAVAELRQKKVLKRLLVTPMRRSSFLASFLLGRAVFLVLELAVLVGFGALALGVPFAAPLLPFALLCAVGGFAFAGLGLAVTARARTIQGASGMLNLAMMPMWLCSGVFFSYERFPEALHPLLRALPLTALVDALRSAMLDGAGLAGTAPQLLVLSSWGAASFVVALRWFRWL